MKFPFKGGEERKKLAKKSKILHTCANHKFIQAKFGMGGELINSFHKGASVRQESVPTCYTPFAWLFSLIIKITMAYLYILLQMLGTFLKKQALILQPGLVTETSPSGINTHPNRPTGLPALHFKAFQPLPSLGAESQTEISTWKINGPCIFLPKISQKAGQRTK